MKKIRSLLHGVVCVLFMLSALVFAAIELWQLVSGDWRLFENELLALVQILAKIMLSLYCFAISLRGVLRWKQSGLWTGIRLLGITLAAAPFVSNRLGYLFVLLAVLFLLSEPAVWRFPGRKNAAPLQEEQKDAAT